MVSHVWAIVLCSAKAKRQFEESRASHVALREKLEKLTYKFTSLEGDKKEAEDRERAKHNAIVHDLQATIESLKQQLKGAAITPLPAASTSAPAPAPAPFVMPNKSRGSLTAAMGLPTFKPWNQLPASLTGGNSTNGANGGPKAIASPAGAGGAAAVGTAPVGPNALKHDRSPSVLQNTALFQQPAPGEAINTVQAAKPGMTTDDDDRRSR